MIENVCDFEDLRGLARARSLNHVTKTVSHNQVETFLEQGWSIKKRNKRTTQLSIQKSLGTRLEDRVWILLYRMGFNFMSGQGGARVVLNPKDPQSPKNQIDVVGIDGEVAIAIECKSASQRARRPQFQEELAKFAQLRETFVRSTNAQFPTSHKRPVGMAVFATNAILSDNDKKRAEQSKIVLMDEADLVYYEALTSHLGPAAKYQFLADLLQGRSVPGLTITVPAIHSNMGGYKCYTFSMNPEYLLKIGYVSHRSKGKASDVNTYQRMISKARLKKIRDYIEDDGIFPTNIVLSLDRSPEFHQSGKEVNPGAGRIGHLTLKPAYKSAWIIDGQHRLFAYSGHKRGSTSRLAVVAFDKLEPNKQKEMFIDINAQQKSVKQSLLQELYAELHWNSEDPTARVRAVVSNAIQFMGDDPDSPFFGRILLADDRRDNIRCITLNALYTELNRPECYVMKPRKGGPTEFGPLWAGDNIEATRDRTVSVMNGWFDAIRSSAPDWWEAGRGEGGGLAMSDAVASCVMVLRSVFAHLDSIGVKWTRLSDEEINTLLSQYASALGSYLGSNGPEERLRFRAYRGIEGRTTFMRLCQEGMRATIEDFNPTGLNEFIETEKAQTNMRAKEIIVRIEGTLQRTIVEELKREFGEQSDLWWFNGIPETARKEASTLMEEDQNQRGGREKYLNLIDYRKVIQANYSLFGQLLGYGKVNLSKDKRTAWLVDVNDARKIEAHASAGRSVSLDQLAQLEGYDSWLRGQILNLDTDQVVAENSEE